MPIRPSNQLAPRKYGATWYPDVTGAAGAVFRDTDYQEATEPERSGLSCRAYLTPYLNYLNKK